MPNEPHGQRPFPSTTKRLRFHELPHAAFTALANGELAAGSAAAGLELGEYFVSDRARWTWNYRAGQLTEDPKAAPWLTQVVLSEPEDTIVGYAGFHGPPDESGMVELGYTVLPEHRRQGYAKAMLLALLSRAAEAPEVRTVRATISPDNEASLATIARCGFERVGEQWDEEDGLEIIFEVPAGSRS